MNSPTSDTNKYTLPHRKGWGGSFKTASPDRYALLKDFARANRKNMTDAECMLWQNIRDGQLGVKFLRQHIIGDYIVDFVCCETGLVIEVDGGYHAESRQIEDDKLRTNFLQSKGFEVIRFSNEEIQFNIDNLLLKIQAGINKNAHNSQRNYNL